MLLLCIAVLLPSFTWLLLFKLPKNASAEWYDEGWSYRTSYSNNNTGSAVTNQKIKLDIDTSTLITNSKLQADCDDSRFTDQNGNILDYFIDTNEADCNNASTDYYVTVPTINSGRTIIYHYYGNPAASRGRKDDFLPPSSSPTLGVGLKGYWKLDETSANTCSGGTNDSCDYAYTNDGAWNGDTTSTAGKLGNGISLDGTGDYIDVGSSTALNPQNAMTLSAWLYPTENSGNNTIHLRGSGVLGDTLQARTENGVPYAYFYVNGGYATANDTVALTLNTWSHYIATYDGTTAKLYINGVLVGQQNRTGTINQINTNTQFGIHRTYTDQIWAGRMDDVRIYNKALSASEVSQMYNSGNGSTLDTPLTFSPASTTASSEEKGPGPVAYWRFDDGQGTTAQDSTTNDLDGTLNNTPTWQTEDMCIAGKCLYFDGTNNENVSRADDAKLDFVAADNFTVGAWVKRSGASTANNFILTKAQTGYTGYKLYQDASGDYCFDVSDGTNTDTACTSAVEFDDNAWHLVQGVKTGTTSLTLYVDGKSRATDSSIAATGTLANTGTLYIGVDLDGTSNEWLGFIDDVKIYNYARSASQIQADYNSRGSSKGVSLRTQGDSLQKNLSDGLVGYWKMDEASANSCSGGVNDNCDSSGNGNDGAWNGNATSAAGKYGNGVTFDGDGDYINLGNLSETANGSISMWFKPTSNITSASARQGLLYDGTIGTYFLLSFNAFGSTGILDFTINDGTDWRRASSTTTSWTAGTWYHVVGTWGTNGIKIYVDSTLQGTHSSTAAPTLAGGNWWIGSDGNGFNGVIDDARIYNRALSPKEVEALYNFAPGPVGYWDFEDGSGSTAADKSGNGNNGTLTVGASGTQTTTSQAWTAGKVGKIGSALNFDGGDDYVSVSSTVTNNPYAITVSAWVKPTSSSLSGQKEIVTGAWATTYRLALIDGGVRGIIRGNILDYTTTTLNANQWSFVAMTWDGSTLTLWRDGVSLTSTSVSGSITLPPSIVIGAMENLNTEFFNGSIDDVRIYNYARTQKQIIEDMGGGHPAVSLAGSLPASSGRSGGPIAYYDFDEGYGTITNNSGYGGSTLNGTMSGFASPATSTSGWTGSGKFNKGLVFDGSNDYVSVGDPSSGALDFTGSFTLSAWVKRTGTGSLQRIINKDSGSTGFGSLFNADNTLTGFFYDSTGTSRATSTTSTFTSTTDWYHIIYTNNSGSNQKIFVNGIERASSTNTQGGTDTTFPLRIGSQSTLVGQIFNGSIDEVKVYPFALTAEEVKLEYNRGAATVLGALGDNTNYDKQAQNQEYCIPGDSSTCTAPVGRWDFEEKSGQTAYDTSGNANNGTLGASTAVGTDDPTWAVGKKGAGLSFDGGDYMNMGNPASGLFNFGTNSFTIEAWFKTSSSTDQVIVSKGVANYSNYYLSVAGGTIRVIYIDASQNGVDTTVGSGYNNNKWHHVSYVLNKTDDTLTVYIDGNKVGNSLNVAAATGGISTGDPLIVGYYRGAGINYFDGTIDDVRIFNYARSAAQVAWDYNRGAPVAHWDFDEGQGGTLYDSSGNGNNGTWNGTAAGTQTAAGDINTSGTAWFNGKTGKFNYSLNFDGTDDWVSGNLTSQTISTFSMTAWVKPTGTAGQVASYGSFLETFQGDTRKHLCRFSAATFNINFHTETDGGAHDMTSNTALTSGEWAHVACIYDGTNKYIYINGKLDKSTATTVTSQTIDNFEMSRSLKNSTWRLTGQLDDVKVFNYALTGTQVKLLMNEGAVRFGPSTGAP